jgi:hypothetical protein
MSSLVDLDGEPARTLHASFDQVTLRVSGGKPIRLRAELLAEATSRTPGATLWQELLLYHSDADEYAVGLTTCRSLAGSNDVFHARVFAQLEQALAWLQDFDPTADLGVELDVSDRRISTTDIALRAAALRQRADRVELQYSTMIGELMFRLDLEG